MRVIALVWALLGAGSTGIALAAQLALPSQHYWNSHHSLVYVAITILVILALQEATRRIRRIQRARSAHAYDRDMRAVLSAALRMTAVHCEVSWEDIGVHAFWLRGRWRFARLVNVGGLRLGARPSMAEPHWRLGKGVVGTAAQLQKVVAEDWQNVFKLGNAEGKAPWMGRPPAERYGLSWGELQLTSDYVGIVACPVFDPRGGQLLGCVTIDMPVTPQALTEVRTQEILRDLALSVALLGGPP